MCNQPTVFVGDAVVVVVGVALAVAGFCVTTGFWVVVGDAVAGLAVVFGACVTGFVVVVG